MNELESKIRQIIADVLDIELNSVSHSSTINNTDGWDSLKHMNIILAIEEELGVQFNDEDILELTSVTALCDKLSK